MFRWTRNLRAEILEATVTQDVKDPVMRRKMSRLRKNLKLTHLGIQNQNQRRIGVPRVNPQSRIQRSRVPVQSLLHRAPNPAQSQIPNPAAKRRRSHPSNQIPGRGHARMSCHQRRGHPRRRKVEYLPCRRLFMVWEGFLKLNGAARSCRSLRVTRKGASEVDRVGRFLLFLRRNLNHFSSSKLQ